MDRSWMYNMDRRSTEYQEKVKEFYEVADAHRKSTVPRENYIACPCVDCVNSKRYRDKDVIMDHLIRKGFMIDYTTWKLHGESKGATSYRGNNHTEIDVNPTSQSDLVGNQSNDDHIDSMLEDVEQHFDERPKVYQNLLEAAERPLYPGCANHTKLSMVLKLFNLKANHGWSDKSFTELLQLLQDILPEGNDVPNSTYEAKKLMCPMGMGYKKIHACPNDCILYWKEYENLQQCPNPKCQLPRYKQKRQNMSGVNRTGPPAKVLWYLPIIPRIKRLFGNEQDAKNLRWHGEERIQDGKLRHPADAAQWRNIDGMFTEFGEEVRNLRLGLCTDGMNPYGTLSSQHSTWPVLLVIYNLPSWLCMKQKYIMLSLLISGPKQPRNDIDVYLAPLIEDLKLLWNDGVIVYDAYRKEEFTLRAMLYCTINDFPAYGNLSGYTVKGACASPINTSWASC